MGDQSCGCKLGCYSKISKAQQMKLFGGFWESGNFDVQNAYICGCVKISKVARRYTAEPTTSLRSYSREYIVQNEGVSTRVCKTAFLRMHGLSNGRVSRALQARTSQGGSLSLDKRGKHEPKNKTSKDKIDLIKAHINSFLKYKSHYSRSDNPHKNYLSPDLSIDKMYRLYKEKCDKESATPVSQWVYRKTFTENFNLSFGK